MHLTLTTNVRISICFHGYVSLLSDYNISNNLLPTRQIKSIWQVTLWNIVMVTALTTAWHHEPVIPETLRISVSKFATVTTVNLKCADKHGNSN